MCAQLHYIFWLLATSLLLLNMDSKFKLIIDSFGKERFKFNESLKDYTTAGIGGPAKLFFIAFTIQELVKIVSMCRELDLTFFIFATGSKIMIAEAGFDGLVIKNRTKDIKISSIKGKVSKLGLGIEEAYVEVESGVSTKRFVEFLEGRGLEALEFASLPGSIGGNLFLSKVLQTQVKSIKVLNLRSQIEQISAKDLSLKKHVILSAIFRIKSK